MKHQNIWKSKIRIVPNGSVFLLTVILILFMQATQAVFASSSVITSDALLQGSAVQLNGEVQSTGEVYERGFELTVDADIQKITNSQNKQNYVLHSKFGVSGNEAGQFNAAYDVAINASGEMYVSDSHHRVQKFDANGNFLLQWGTPGSANGQFNYPGEIAIDAAQNVYVVDINNYRVQKFDANGNYLTKWGSQGIGSGQFDKPYGIAINSGGFVYVSDIGSNQVRKFDSSGNFITWWGGLGSGNTEFNSPYFLAVDEDDNVYVSDTGNHRVQRYDENGSFLNNINLLAVEVAPGLLTSPSGVSVRDGIAYVVSLGGNIYKFSTSGNFLVTIFDSSSVPQEDRLSSPRGAEVDSNGRIVVVDRNNSRIQKLELSSSSLLGEYNVNHDITDLIEAHCDQSLQYRAYARINEQTIFGESKDIEMADCPPPFVVPDLKLDITLMEPGLMQDQDSSYRFSITKITGDKPESTQLLVVVPDELALGGPFVDGDEHRTYSDNETYSCMDYTDMASSVVAFSYHLGRLYLCSVPLLDSQPVSNVFNIELPFSVTGPVNSSTTMRGILFSDDIDTGYLNGQLGSEEDIFSLDVNNIATYVGANPGSTLSPPVEPSPVYQTALQSPQTNKPILLETPEDTTITCSTTLKESTQTAKDGSYDYPLGLVEFCFDTENPTNQVNLTFVTNMKPDQVKARKYNTTSGTYFDIKGATITETVYQNQPALRLTYAITDNGELDLDLTVGSIKDPVGLAVSDTNDGLAKTGISQNLLLSGVLILFSILGISQLVGQAYVSNKMLM